MPKTAKQAGAMAAVLLCAIFLSGCVFALGNRGLKDEAMDSNFDRLESNLENLERQLDTVEKEVRRNSPAKAHEMELEVQRLEREVKMLRKERDALKEKLEERWESGQKINKPHDEGESE